MEGRPVSEPAGHVPAAAAGEMSLAGAACPTDPAKAQAEPSPLLPALAAGNIWLREAC